MDVEDVGKEGLRPRHGLAQRLGGAEEQKEREAVEIEKGGRRSSTSGGEGAHWAPFERGSSHEFPHSLSPYRIMSFSFLPLVTPQADRYCSAGIAGANWGRTGRGLELSNAAGFFTLQLWLLLTGGRKERCFLLFASPRVCEAIPEWTAVPANL